MEKLRLMIVAGAMCAALYLLGCDVATNPLMFDGPPVSANFAANTNGSAYADARSLDLAGIMAEAGTGIDSISVINVTLQIDSLSGGTLPSTTLSGTGSADGHTLLTLSGVALATFSSERSIFDPSLAGAGVTYGSAGVSYVNSRLKNPDSWSSPLTIAILGTASQNGLHFKAHIRLYTQVFTHP